ncbi:MAG: sigma-70 family RNA polymerase sigma factor [Fimbriimonadaceae bacterium]|nr:sigma-70 family RNA polymerase sigma factor [Fimbriimonadaceae bacterium]QYK57108.1 MAG: sigma-70 family RNA polymerase sigma factor [Fimbriimonadaceae bacterium]
MGTIPALRRQPRRFGDGGAQRAAGADDAVKAWLERIGEIPLLSAEQERRVAECSAQGCPECRRELIEHNLRLVVGIAAKFAGTGVPLQDLIQEGNIGLMNAAARFDPSRGHRFSTYATWWVRQAVSRAAANQSGLVRVPAHARDAKARLQHLVRRMARELRREPSLEELGSAAGASIEDVRFQLSPSPEVSFVGSMEEDAWERIAPTTAGNDFDVLVDEEVAHVVRRLIETLPTAEREVTMRRYGLSGEKPQSVRAVAEALRLKPSEVRQAQARALARLRHPMLSSAIRDALSGISYGTA